MVSLVCLLGISFSLTDPGCFSPDPGISSLWFLLTEFEWLGKVFLFFMVFRDLAGLRLSLVKSLSLFRGVTGFLGKPGWQRSWPDQVAWERGDRYLREALSGLLPGLRGVKPFIRGSVEAEAKLLY